MQYFLIDFDSTFINTEGLDELATIALKDNPNKEKILNQIKTLTMQTMEGQIPFDQSLNQRLQLLKATRQDVEKVASYLKNNISNSILRNKSFFQTHKKQIFIISGGFKELILPVVEPFDILHDHIFANTFTFDAENNITGCDKQNPLSQENGKTKLVKSLNLQGKIYIIGDGYSDYQIKQSGLAQTFIAFTENIQRKNVIQKADHIAPNFEEVLKFI